MSTTNLFEKAHQYLKGLFSIERTKRNIERMTEKTNYDYHTYQHFITDSSWDARKLVIDNKKSKPGFG